MKFCFSIFMVNLVSILCISGAILLAYNDKSGWGWLLFVAIICAGGSVSTKTTDDKEPSEKQ